MLRFMKNLRILQSSSFIKAYVFYLFEFSLGKKTNVNFIYRVSDSLYYNATQQLFRECQLHTFHNKNIFYRSINAQTLLKFKSNYRIFLGSNSQKM